MRINRLGALLVALLTALALTVSLAPSTAAVSASPAAAEPKPKHEFKRLEAGETATEGRFFVRGQVTSYRKRVVVLQKQKEKGAPWRKLKSKRSNKWGGFKFNFGGKIGNGYRVKLRGTPWRSKTFKFIGRIVPERNAGRLTAR